MLKEVAVGTCGFSVKGGRRSYYRLFSVVEVQDTFYRIVRESTLEKWRREAPPDFEFTLKAFQGVTHSPSSPTWRRANIRLDDAAKKNYGFFRPTREVKEAWKYTLNAAKILRSNVIVVQTPASFKPTKENIENMENFFKANPRDNIIIAWEPRGEWYDYKDVLSKILEKLDLVHIVDPLKRPILRKTPVYYFRLHGLGRGDVNYRYKYTDEDLSKLVEIVEQLKGERAYVMFNNVHMADDARRFKQLALKNGLKIK